MQNVIEVDFTNYRILQESNEVDYPKYCLEKLINNISSDIIKNASKIK